MRKYEVPVVAMPLLPEDIKTKLVPAVEKAVAKYGGTVQVKEEWGKRHLAYSIPLANGSSLEEGYYLFFSLTLEPANLEVVQKELKRIKDIVRFLVIREDQL